MSGTSDLTAIPAPDSAPVSPHRMSLSGPHGAKVAALMLILAFLVQGAAALNHMSPTGDETHYLSMGVYLVENQDWTVLADALLHPPLSYYLHSLPLFFVPIDRSVFDIPDINQRGRTIIASRSDDRILMLARIPILLMGVGLGLLIYTWSRQAYGRKAALLALTLYTFNPVILGNAAIITPDLCLTFFAVLTYYCLWRFSLTFRNRTLVVAGIAMGLCLLSKYSGVLVVLSVPLIIVSQSLFSRTGDRRGGRLHLGHFAVMLLVALLIVNAGYFFSGSLEFVDDEAFRSDLFRTVQGTGITGWFPSPLPVHYLRGMDLQYTVVEDGFNYFLLGEKSDRGWFHYYLVSFLVKTPVTFLLLLASTIVLSIRARVDRLQWLLLVPIVFVPLYFSVFLMSRGIRYVLLIYPLLGVWISRCAPLSEQRLGSRVRPVYLAVLLAVMAESLWVAPHYLAYFNVAAGGPSHGQNYLFESEFDWGQELKGLKAYLDRNGIERIKLGYFGTGDPGHYGIDFEPLEACEPIESDDPVAVSATALQFWDCFEWLHDYEPVDRVGYTIFLYELPPKS